MILSKVGVLIKFTLLRWYVFGMIWCVCIHVFMHLVQLPVFVFVLAKLNHQHVPSRLVWVELRLRVIQVPQARDMAAWGPSCATSTCCKWHSHGGMRSVWIWWAEINELVRICFLHEFVSCTNLFPAQIPELVWIDVALFSRACLQISEVFTRKF